MDAALIAHSCRPTCAVPHCGSSMSEKKPWPKAMTGRGSVTASGMVIW